MKVTAPSPRLWLAEIPKIRTIKRVVRVNDLDHGAFRAQGIVGVDVITRTFIASSSAAGSPQRHPLNALQAWLFFACARIFTIILPPVSGASPDRFRLRRIETLHHLGKASRPSRVYQLSATSKQVGVGRLCQVTLSRTRKTARLHRPRHTPRGNLEQSFAGYLHGRAQLTIKSSYTRM